MRTFILAGAFAIAAGPASAACHWNWDCTGGPCRQIPICDSTLDIPPIRPSQIAPIPAPTIPPIATPVIPPIGTSQCRPTYICAGMGQCSWQTVCR